jgi:hypothetical protein
MVWPFSRSVSEEQAGTLRRRCASRVSALAVCRAANPKGSCDSFQADCALCQATVLCEQASQNYMKCTAAAASASSQATLPDCGKQLKTMQRCLARFKLPK